MSLFIPLLFLVITFLIIIAPFFISTDSERLASGSSDHSAERLLAEKAALVKSYVAEEKLFNSNKMHKLQWQQRRLYLISRYIDASKRLDFISHTDHTSSI